jgi:uncharacterized protein CbrC (UPF0167 family)
MADEQGKLLPQFKYHPDPIATGAFKLSDATCQCCGEARGYIYAASVYAEEDVESVCPWCIADGSLEQKHDAMLNDDLPLHAAGLPSEVIREVTRRTPGYISWQQDSWIVCCNDACEFHGDAPEDEIRALDEEGIAALSAESGFSIEDLKEMVSQYEPGGSPAFYKFVCRHCSRVKYNGDCD